MVVNFTDYSGKIPDGSRFVFEEEIKRLLKAKKIDTITPDDLLELVSTVEGDVNLKHQILIDIIKNISNNQLHDLSIVKNIMTMDGRLVAHNDKLVLTEGVNNLGIASSDIDGHVTGLSFTNNFKPLFNDPGKNAVTISKIITNCVDDEMIPIFTINTKPCKRKSYIQNSDIGKLLLEVRISTPLMNFKGFITTGLLENVYGVGFFAEYCTSVDPDKFIIKAFYLNGIVSFYIIKKKTNELSDNIYNNAIPLTINVSPLIVNGLTIEQSIPLKIERSNLTSIEIGTGDLTSNGHGPIDCITDSDNVTIVKYLKSEYYRGNKDLTCATSAPVKSKVQSKYFNIKVQPTSFGITPSVEIGSHALRSTFGNSNFDMLNLLKEIYNFVEMKQYKCFGNIVLNNVIIPVIGFVVDRALGRVSFTISPYFIIPTEKMFKDESIQNPKIGLILRDPKIVFETNINKSISYSSGGFIGDIDSKNLNGDPHASRDGLFIMGTDSVNTVVDCRTAKYTLSLVDITIELEDSSGLINNLKWNKPFRYSGDFNRYNHDFTKSDFDSYPYPGLDRDISDNIGEVGNIPSLTPENLVICTSDDKTPLVWSDNTEEYISYSNNSVQQ